MFKLPIILQLQINTMDDLTANTATEKRFHASLLLTPIPIVPGNSACERQPLQKKVNYRRIAVISGLPARQSAAVAPDLFRVAPLLRLGNHKNCICAEKRSRSGAAEPQTVVTAQVPLAAVKNEKHEYLCLCRHPRSLHVLLTLTLPLTLKHSG